MRIQHTVLVVDDDELSRQLVQSVLASENYAVSFAHDGVEALKLAEKISPDVILLDLLMPHLDGFEVCRQLRANPALRQVPIVVLTGLEGRNARLRGLELGADEFLTKPVDPVELRTRVRTIIWLNRFRQLCDLRARFEAAVGHSPDAIALTDGDGRILNSNASFHRLMAVPCANILQCFPSATAEKLRADLAGLDRDGAGLEMFESALVPPAKPGLCVDASVVRLPWSEGTMILFVLRDITDRKHLEAQVMRLQRIELLGQVASGIVHDVNNLLNAIRLTATSLEVEGKPADVERARIIEQSATRGGDLLRRILMFARGGDQEMLPILVPPILRETAGISEKLLGRNVVLEVDAPDDLPIILGDANQLHQVVMNLCVNARDAMPRGGKLVLEGRLARLSAAEAEAIGPDASPGEFVTISVRDTGVGIPEDIRDKLFDPFFTTKPRETATGLGLATVLRVTKRHHGFIAFDSKVGTGSCFTCYFPALTGVSSQAPWRGAAKLGKPH